MLEQDHSHITHSSRSPSDSRSDLRSLHHLRQLLPGHHPIAALDNYLIEEDSSGDRSWSSGGSEEGRDLMAKITEQTHQILQLTEQLYYYKTEFYRLAKQITPPTQTQPPAPNPQPAAQQHSRDRQWEEQLAAEMQKRVQLEERLRRKEGEVDRMRTEVAELQKELATRTYQRSVIGSEEVRYQQQVILELAVKNEKVMRINAFLIEQLRAAEAKLIELERDDQQKICGQLFENFYRLKENNNHSNRKNENMHSRALRSHTAAPQGHPYPTTDPPQIQHAPTRHHRKDSSHTQSEKQPQKPNDHEPTPAEAEKMNKLQPLQEPKPQRKLPRTSEAEPSKKFQRAADWQRHKS